MNILDELARRSPEYLDTLYQQFLRDPDSVDSQWRLLFAGYEFGLSSSTGAEPQRTGVFDLVHTYRELGHTIAAIDPLEHTVREHPLLDIREFGFGEQDLNRHVGSGGFVGIEQATLAELLQALRDTYCGTIGVEYLPITNKEQRDWLQQQMEPTRNRAQLDGEARLALWRRLREAEAFEQYLHTQYVGAKRFSLEGGEALIPMLDELIETLAGAGAQEVVLGMPHRGRLNVLAHILRKPLARIFAEFEGVLFPADVMGAGDVKYHLGYSCDMITRHGDKVHLSLSFNPSHLEMINPVAEGIVRCKQDVRRDVERNRIVPILLHGEAAFAGQGVVYETLMAADLAGYTTGGTIHVIVNNQIGFTTSPWEGRSTYYASDVAKVIQAPVFHVNADDPEAVVQAARLAAQYRQRFAHDVVIDLVCYRRRGHNELDDPTWTQPVMYREIKAHPTVTQLYRTRLERDHGVEATAFEEQENQIRAHLDEAHRKAGNYVPRETDEQAFAGLWLGLSPQAAVWEADTRIDRTLADRIIEAVTTIPEAFTPHPRLDRMLEQVRKTHQSGTGYPWVLGEYLAYGSLLAEGYPVRLAGQDVKRGTFSHRHAAWWDWETGDEYVPLNHICNGQATFEVINSPLNEAGVLGFEYGYASVDPNRLVIWEAQFGDFANVAQVMIDQFITSAEAKWQRGCGLVMYLPHGYEGQGPEHSSARPERFLQLCAENNIQVMNLTRPAQLFHALRRQLKRDFRKPLVIMTPKSLLRHPRAVSDLSEFTEASFAPVLDDATVDPDAVRKVLLMTGKVYYALDEARAERGRDDIALIRVEQLYPFPEETLAAVLSRYENAREFAWVQEEPKNQGAWFFVEPRLAALLPARRKLGYIGRAASASPAAGSYRKHVEEETALINEAVPERGRARSRASTTKEA